MRVEHWSREYSPRHEHRRNKDEEIRIVASDAARVAECHHAQKYAEDHYYLERAGSELRQSESRHTG